ncbi:MAG: hypothetical protein KatS3mg082_2488 [Nitrospiraceae bacterium]|nr:MAG: hypothetical protein KatS3mg082_2488 [Nitrospiraceae bacterium]
MAGIASPGSGASTQKSEPEEDAEIGIGRVVVRVDEAGVEATVVGPVEAGDDEAEAAEMKDETVDGVDRADDEQEDEQPPGPGRNRGRRESRGRKRRRKPEGA